MGYFTWTDARRKPKLTKFGNYSNKDKIPYGGYAKIVCPDDTEIIETNYEGYGEFNNIDVYDLVVEWNKNHLKEIFDRKTKENPDYWGKELYEIAIAYQNDDPDLQNKIDATVTSTGRNYLKKEWKRNIGITISCDEKDNTTLPYPIKITATKWHKTYDELVPSCSCQ